MPALRGRLRHLCKFGVGAHIGKFDVEPGDRRGRAVLVHGADQSPAATDESDRERECPAVGYRYSSS